MCFEVKRRNGAAQVLHAQQNEILSSLFKYGCCICDRVNINISIKLILLLLRVQDCFLYCLWLFAELSGYKVEQVMKASMSSL